MILGLRTGIMQVLLGRWSKVNDGLSIKVFMWVYGAFSVSKFSQVGPTRAL